MTTKDFLKTIEWFMKERYALLVKKNADYTTQDPFSNFYAEELGIGTEQAILFMIKVKYNRIANLLSNGKDPNFESITDTIRDMANYLDILNAYLKSKE